MNFSFSQEKTNQLDDKGLRHGLWKGFFEESKRPRYEGVFNHGQETAVFKYFDDTKAGSVIATRDFTKGKGNCYTIVFDQKGNKVSKIYGCVTTGNVWQFLVLDEKNVFIDTTAFDITEDIERIFGLLWAMSFGEIDK